MKKLRIGISARGLNSYASGPNEYIAGLTGELIQQAAGRHDILIYYNTERLLGRFAGALERVVTGENAFIWDHWSLPRALKRDMPDLVIYPKGTISFWIPSASVPIMLDLGYFYPVLNAYKPLNTLYTRTAMKFAAHRSALIFAISEHTRADVIRLLKVDASVVHNIYGAASSIYKRVTDCERLDVTRKKYQLADPFIFYPASLSPRKNFPRLLDAFEKIQDQIPHHLYFTGQVSWNTKGLEDRLAQLSTRVHRLGQVPSEDMPAIYSLAQFIIYPSVFEGLGLPVLESFQCGVPVLASGQTSVPEITGKAALTVDAYNVDSIAQGMLKLAGDADLRRELVAAGYEQVKLFTWEKSVRKLLDVLEEHFC
jgi:glycosyltransferase involved in cell wall biosynthesis